MSRILLIVFLFSSCILFAQENSRTNTNKIYTDNIKSVKFHLNGLPLTKPMLDLNSNSQLLLSFDDLSEDVTDYIYTITLCNKDWTFSDLDELDYIDGFNGERINDYEFSYNTRMNYTNYKLTIPNDDIRWTLSGNYLLQVYEDDADRTLVLTRRFMVVEPIMQIIPEIVSPSKPGKYKTHQEIDFLVNYKGIDVNNARQNISAVVLQNGRWDNAIEDIKPVYIKGEDLLFDYQDKITFEAGKDFRQLDLRSFRYLTQQMADIDKTNDRYDVILLKEKPRTYVNFNTYKDLNGDFIIEHMEEENGDVEGDYASVFFALSVSQELLDTDVYIFGGLTDWQLKDEFKMVYNPTIGSYVGRALLKQGFYNYYYIEKPIDRKISSHEELEGNWHQTENSYTILVYWKPFGARHDRLVGARTFSSVN